MVRNCVRDLASIAIAIFTVAGVGCMGIRPLLVKPAAVPVPPTQEIEILDPAQGATHVPAVVLSGAECGKQKLDVPPAVLVHRYYPSGDRDFQAQFLPGGPTIVSVNHPITLERAYVMTTMPPGAPRVRYSGRSIVYDFGPQSVTVSFGPLGRQTVTYSTGTEFGERAKKT